MKSRCRVFGEFPEGKFDRYYFTFSEPHNVGSFTSSNESVSLRVDSPTVLVVEIGEAVAGLAMLAAGSLMVSRARRLD